MFWFEWSENFPSLLKLCREARAQFPSTKNLVLKEFHCVERRIDFGNVQVRSGWDWGWGDSVLAGNFPKPWRFGQLGTKAEQGKNQANLISTDFSCGAGGFVINKSVYDVNQGFSIILINDNLWELIMMSCQVSQTKNWV